MVPLPGVVWEASSATRPTGMLRNVAETAAPRGCSANGGLSHGDTLHPLGTARVRCASQTPPRLETAGESPGINGVGEDSRALPS
ncbi:MAG: hypothetical protein NT118_08675, partial [Lentisphaerae bacterium]|nr:hypothetical protein [Lentisphaerota bacterium]